ncbi:MAG: hypothetical protein Q9166_000848 [cf. Caloplaca sp. 2 TL-2023]
MLLRFQIRNLQSRLGQPSLSVARPVSTSQNVLISLDTNEYDELVTNLPPAALKYVDEEDGEIIRVGSSTELVQRLDDPVPDSPSTRTKMDILSSHPSTALHTFDVIPTTAALAIWTIFGERTKRLTALPPGSFARSSDSSMSVVENKSTMAKPNTLTNSESLSSDYLVGKALQNSQTQTAMKVQTNTLSFDVPCSKDHIGHLPSYNIDLRSHHFHTSNPPMVQPVNRNLLSQGLCSSNLTGEGRRQAQAAGDRLRARNIYSNHPCISAVEDKSPMYQNRWALYGQSPATFTHSVPVQDTYVTKNLISSDKEDVQTFGEKARDKTTSVRPSEPRSHIPGSGVVKNHYSSYSLARPLRFDHPSVDPCSTKSTKLDPLQDTQSSLIEVFDKELARLSTTGSKTPDESSTDTVLKPLVSPTATPGSANRSTLPQGETSSLLLARRMQDLTARLQLLGPATDGSNTLHTLQYGIHAALEALCISILDALDSIQESPNARESRITDDEETAKALHGKAINDLKDLATNVSMLQTKILPVLQDYMEQRTLKTPGIPDIYDWAMIPDLQPNENGWAPTPVLPCFTTPAPPYDHNNSSAAEAPGKRLQSVDPSFSVPKQPETIKWTQKAMVPKRLSTCQASRSCQCAFDSTTSSPNGPSGLSRAQARHPTMSKSSGFERHRHFPDTQESTAASHDASLTAECRFPSLELFEQESSSRSPAFRQNSNQQPLMAQPEHKSPSSLNTCEDETAGTAINADPPDPVIDVRALHDTDPLNDRQSYQSLDQDDRGMSTDFTDVTEHADAATVGSVQTCVEELQKLGFGLDAERSLNRLIVYAQAAGGDLAEAIDIITEEKQAYHQSPRGWNQRFLA